MNNLHIIETQLMELNFQLNFQQLMELRTKLSVDSRMLKTLTCPLRP